MLDGEGLLLLIEVPMLLLGWCVAATGLALLVGRAARIGEQQARRRARSWTTTGEP